jgi:hypothetical protein
MKQVLNTNGVDRTQALWQYVTGQNIPEWGASKVYFAGDTVIYNSLGWYATQSGMGDEPSNGSDYWTVYDAVGTGARNLVIKDAYFIGPPLFYAQAADGVGYANWGAYPLIDGDYGVSYQPYPTVPQSEYDPVIDFIPFAIEKDKLTYKTGFESSQINLTLRPRDPSPQAGSTPNNISSPYKRGALNENLYPYPLFSQGLQANPPYMDVYQYSSGIYQTMRQSFAQTTDWYLAPVTMYRFFMPTPGDVTTFGAAVMFRGRISEMTVDREDIKLTVASLMEIFKTKVPSQTIQPGNRWAPFDFQSVPYVIGSIHDHEGGYNWGTFYFDNMTVVTDGALNEGYVLINDQTSGATYFRHVYANYNTQAVGGGGQYSTVVFVEPLPISLNGASGAQAKFWQASDTATNPDGPGSGFPYVPQPLTGVT